MSSPLREGASFGRYEILRLLGQGGMGTVYRARDTRLQRTVALKVLHVEQTAPEALARQNARLLHEARAAAAITHVNAVSIFDVGELDGTPFLAMEYIEGRTLRSVLSGAAIDVAEASRWLTAVARALAAAHDQGLLHRDIKPENVMVRQDGVVKVLDFGIAAASDVVEPLGVTISAAIGEARRDPTAGTPGYKAPEQMRGEELDGRSDQFGWGVLAYEMLSGARPWSLESVGALASKTLAYAPAPLRSRVPEVPEAVEAVVMRALSAERDARFASMHEVVRALDASGSLEVPATTGRSGAPEPAEPAAAKTIPTRRVAPVLQALAVIVIGAALAGAALHVPSAHAPPAPSSVARAASPASRNPEAVAAYRMGAQAFRDASKEAATTSLDRATEIDGTFAAAHLLAVVNATWPDPPAREHYVKSLQFRASLDPREAALLEALEGYMRVPQDLAESERRLTVAVERYHDATTLYVLAHIRSLAGNFRGSIEACEQALHADPSFAMALRLKAYGLVELGETDAGLAAYDACLRVSPAATRCLRQQLSLLQYEGRCEDALANARHLIAIDPGRPLWHDLLAETLYATGAPLDSVRLAMQESAALLPAAEALDKRLQLEAALAISSGDFDRAERVLATQDAAHASSNEENDHAWVTLMRMDVALEAGLPRRASEIADRFLKRRHAWVPVHWIDASIWAWVVQYRAGTLSKGAFDELRSRWMLAESKRGVAAGAYGSGPGLRWTIGYAAAVTNAEDAKEALELLPRYEPLPDAATRSSDYDSQIGEAFLLGGRAAEGLPYLTRAAKACLGLLDSIDTVRAACLQGQALEAVGKRDEACAAYREVIARWGNARPRSVSAEKSGARAAALRCGR